MCLSLHKEAAAINFPSATPVVLRDRSAMVSEAELSLDALCSLKDHIDAGEF